MPDPTDVEACQQQARERSVVSPPKPPPGVKPELMAILQRLSIVAPKADADADHAAEERQARANDTEYLQRVAGVPPMFIDVDLENVPAYFPAEYARMAKRLCVMVDRPQTMVLTGDVGRGKTALGCGLARLARTRRKSARYVTACRYLAAVAEADFGRKAKVRESYERPDVIVVDEVGDPFTHQPGRDGELLELVDRRFTHRRSTLLLTNLTTEAFEATYGAKLKRRIVESKGGFHSAMWPRLQPLIDANAGCA